MATRSRIGSRGLREEIKKMMEREKASSGKMHFGQIKALGFYFLLRRLSGGSLIVFI